MKPKIFYSIATKVGGQGLSLVAKMASEAIEKNHMLEQLVCFGIHNDVNVFHINQIFFQPAKIFSHLPSKYYYSMKRRWLDFRASHYLNKSTANIFHGWTHESLKSIQVARSKGMIVILERGNPHPLYSKMVLEKEYKKYKKLNFFHIEDKNLFLRNFNHYRYELNEAIKEIDLADYIFVNSKFCKMTYIFFGVEAKKLIMIPRGFDPKSYFPRKPQTPSEPFVVIFVGEMLLRKGIKYILEAWKKVSRPQDELWFVGSVSDEVSDMLKLYCKTFENIKCLGKQSNPSVYLQKASVFLFPSLDEGSAKVTYEAMATGLPCIFTENSGSLATKDSAIFVPIRSSKSIAEAIVKLRNDVNYRNRLGKKAAKTIQQFTWKRYQKTLIETYKKILAD
jgi:glycosyltransferase involved in cell wall biosynthesis